MTGRRLLALCAVAAALLIAVVAAPDAAFAHGGGAGRQDLPIPKWLFGWAASIVLIASFVGLAVLWQRPRLENRAERRLASIPRLLDPICGAIGLGLFALVVYAGFAGSQETANNIAFTFIFYAPFWVALVPASVLLGDVFKAFNPWRAFGRGVAWIATKVSHDRLPAPLAYPPRLGHWPAAATILAFVWIELVYEGSSDPSKLAVLALAYGAVQLIGMSLYGIEAWSRLPRAAGLRDRRARLAVVARPPARDRSARRAERHAAHRLISRRAAQHEAAHASAQEGVPCLACAGFQRRGRSCAR